MFLKISIRSQRPLEAVISLFQVSTCLERGKHTLRWKKIVLSKLVNGMNAIWARIIVARDRFMCRVDVVAMQLIQNMLFWVTCLLLQHLHLRTCSDRASGIKDLSHNRKGLTSSVFGWTAGVSPWQVARLWEHRWALNRSLHLWTPYVRASVSTITEQYM